jgi:uncharacterized protein
MPSRVLVSGASGPIGTDLLPSLAAQGYQVVQLSRHGSLGPGQRFWDPVKPLDPLSVSGFEAVIHLAGESLVGRWSAGKKALILNSRVLGTRHLAEALAKSPQPPRVLISASAVGYYGDRGDEILREDSASGTGFLPEVCRQWEQATGPASAAGIRVVLIRIGLVLSPRGGALQQMLRPFRWGIGGKLGSGSQWWSWIDSSDLVGSVQHILGNHSLQGAVNLVSPQPVRNLSFTRLLAEALSRPAMFAIPASLARLALGEIADEALLASVRAEPARLLASGYIFQQPDLRRALEAILNR